MIQFDSESCGHQEWVVDILDSSGDPVCGFSFFQ